MIDELDDTFTILLRKKEEEVLNKVVEVVFQMIPKHRLFPFSYTV
jgi:hypothetical protein